MNDPVVRRALAFTITAVFVLLVLAVAIRDRQLDPTVAGGLIAILGSIVALFATRDTDKGGDDESRR
jgi:predicted branched-subunit amino acid permease